MARADHCGDLDLIQLLVQEILKKRMGEFHVSITGVMVLAASIDLLLPLSLVRV
jgi:hypothetical protein